MTRARLFFRNNPSQKLDLTGKQILLGRADECDIVIDDPYVSRKQARIEFSARGVILENIGSNPISINRQQIAPGERTQLHNRDTLDLGKTCLVFSLDETKPEPEPEPVIPPRTGEETIICTAPTKPQGPYIMATGPAGESRTIPLDKTSSIRIGRAGDNDLTLPDQTVSRYHAIIEPGPEGFFIRGTNPANPVIVNGRSAEKTKLFSGDRINLGQSTLLFFSDRDPDIRRAPGPAATKPASRLPFWSALLLLLLIAAGGFSYFQLYRPWAVSRQLTQAAQSLEQGKLDQAAGRLTSLLAGELPRKERERARKLLARATLLKARKLAEKQDLKGAQKELAGFLKKYGGFPEAQPVWEELDLYRMEIGRRLAARENYLEAMKAYAAIQPDSPVYDLAQQKISRVWLEYQKKKFNRQTIYQLIQEAEEAFRKKHYLSPVNHNAYAAYQAILSLDPANQLARKRIAEIRGRLKDDALTAFSRKEYQKALDLFEQYLFITPEDREIKQAAEQCRERLAAARGTEKSDRHKEKVRRLLEKSGANPSWIMKYLFEEESGKEDTPW